MAEARGELDMYSQWFLIADADKDGVLSGPEAVQFFLRSGLPQHPTLFKIWQYVAGDRPALSRQEFYTAMKLVSLAQINNGVLDDAQAMRLVNGLAGPIQPPTMQGLAIPKGMGMDVPATAAGMPRPPVVPVRPAYLPAAPGVPAGPPSATSMYPPLTAEQAHAFQNAFTQLDLDRDGFVQGVDCFGAFMQSGLPKEVLKAVWDLVAGDAGHLNRHQFVQALYLIDCVKRGIPLPQQLPPGQFPPVAGTVNISQMMGTPQDIYQASLAVPPMMPRAVYQPPGAPPAVNFPSQVPSFEAGRVAALEAAERTRLEAEREAALKLEQERKKAEEERAAAQAKRDFFTNSLAELRLAQSKVTRAVVEGQQRCEMERAEAERMEADYNRAYADFSVKHAQNAPLVEALKKIQEDKAALGAKLESLRVVVQQLESVDPEWELREKGECEELNKEIAVLTVHREGLQRTADAVERQRGELAGHIAALKAAAAGVDGELAPLREQIEKLATEAGKEGEVVVGLLKQLAPLYNTLYDTAKKAMVPLPAEALATIKREAAAFKYDDLLVAGAESWGDFKDEGFKIVSALPVDTRLMTFTSPALAAAAAEGSDSPVAEAEAEASDPAAAGAAAAADGVLPAATDAPEEGTAAADDAEDIVPAGEVPGSEGGASASGSPAAKSAGASVAGSTAGSQRPSRGASDAQAQAAEAPGELLGKQPSSAEAEAEAVHAAAEAGVLASAIAEALAASKPGSKSGSAAPSKQGSSAAEAFAVTFDTPEGDPALPPAVEEGALPPMIPADAFAEGFEALSLDEGAAAKVAEPAVAAAPLAAAEEVAIVAAAAELEAPAQPASVAAGDWAAF